MSKARRHEGSSSGVKIAKWIAGIVLGLFALVALTVITLTLVIDPNRYRGRLETAVKDATGRPFRLAGDLKITWYPWLAVETGRAELGNPPGTEGPPLVQWKTARMGVRLIPLIHGELDIDRIRFEGLSIALKRTADGQANWENLLKPGGDPSREKRFSAPRIAGLEIHDGALDFVDEKAGSHFQLAHWNLDIGPVDINADMSQVAVPEWSFKVAEAQLAGSLNATLEPKPLRASGALSVQLASARKFFALLRIEAPLPKDKTAMGPLSLKTSWALTDGAIAVKPIELKLDDTAFTGELARSNAAEPLWTFDLHGDRIDLRRYLITEETSDEPFELPVKALKALRVQGTLVFDQARFADADMKNARLRVNTP